MTLQPSLADSSIIFGNMAETPPPFQMPPPPAARATNSANRACLVIALLLLAFCAIGAVIAFVFMKGVWGQVSSTAGCVGTFELSHTAAIAYSKEHGGRLPSADKWQAEIKPYYDRLYTKMSKEFEDVSAFKGFLPSRSDEVLQCKWEGRVTGIAYNAAVAGKLLKDFKEPTKTVMFFETDESAKSLTRLYKEMPKAQAPKIMYNDREWIVYYLEGNKDPFKTSGSTTTTFELTPEDALPPSTESSGEATKDGQK